MGIVLLSIAVLLLTPIATQVRAHSGHEIFAVYGTTPTIDGTISDGEWDDASTVTFPVFEPETDNVKYTCTVYVKQNGTHLHVAFDIPDTTYEPDDDQSVVLLDVNHLGGTWPQTDDFWLRVWRNETKDELLGTGSGWTPATPAGWTAAKSEVNGGFQTEYSITYSKISVTAGQAKTLGVMFKTWDGFADASGWPTGSSPFSPGTWADLTSPAPWFWIPGMPLGAIAAITACFGGLGIKKLRRTPKKTT